MKDTKGKPIFSRVPTRIIRGIEKVREYGDNKYKPDSWKEQSYNDYREAFLRHCLDFWDGKELDEESGLPVLWHLATNIDFMLWFKEKSDLDYVKSLERYFDIKIDPKDIGKKIHVQVGNPANERTCKTCAYESTDECLATYVPCENWKQKLDVNNG